MSKLCLIAPRRHDALSLLLRHCFLLFSLWCLALSTATRQAQESALSNSPARSSNASESLRGGETRGQFRAVDFLRLLSERDRSTHHSSPTHGRVRSSRHVNVGLLSRLVQGWAAGGGGLPLRQSLPQAAVGVRALYRAAHWQPLHSSNSWRVQDAAASGEQADGMAAAAAVGQLSSAGQAGAGALARQKSQGEEQAQVAHRSHGWFPAVQQVSKAGVGGRKASTVHHSASSDVEEEEMSAGRVSVPSWHVVTTSDVQGNNAVAGGGSGSREKEWERQWVMAGAKVAAQQSKQAGSRRVNGNPFLYNPNWPWRRAGRGPCSASNVTIRATSIKDLMSRKNHPPRRTVTIRLLNSIALPTAFVFDASFSCTILMAGSTGVRLTVANASTPILNIWNTSNVLIYGVNFDHPVTEQSPGCTTVPDSQNTGDYTCPAIQVWKSYGVQIVKGSVFGRVEVVRSMHVSIDSMRLTNIYSYEKGLAPVRILISGDGPSVTRSGISVSNNNIGGSNHGIILHFGAVGVDVYNNYIHNCDFTAIRCGDILNAVGDCMATNIFRNFIYNPPSKEWGQNTDATGIYYQTHWLNPGNYDTCNYIQGTDHCYFLDNTSSGVQIIGGVCIGTGRGIKTNAGKRNVIQYVLQKGVFGPSVNLQCLNVDTNCGSQWGRYYVGMYQRFYNTPQVNKIAPWFSTLCTTTTANGYPCNPPGGYPANESAGCSGIATDNSMDVILVSPVATNTPPSYLFCNPSVYQMNNLSSITKDASFFEFINMEKNNLGVRASSPIYSLKPNFRSCNRQAVGPRKRMLVQYIRQYNIPRPTSFAKVANLDYSQIQDIYYNP